MDFKVGDVCVVVDSIQRKWIGKIVVITAIQYDYYKAIVDDVNDPYPFIKKELRKATKLDKLLFT